MRRRTRRGAGRQAQMSKDSDDHQRIFNRSDLQGTAAVGAVSDVDIEDTFEQPGPAHARRFSRGRGVISWWLVARCAGAGTILLRFAFGACTPCLIVVSGQKRWKFLPGIRNLWKGWE